MYKKKVLFSFFAMVLFAFSGVSVFAQQTPLSDDAGKMENVIVIATVNITQAEVTKQENGILEVTYTVNNETGIQPDIRASLGLLDDKNRMITEQVASEVFTLREKEERVKTITLQIPDFLKGEFKPVITLATESGLLLSVHPLDTKVTLSGTNNDFISFQGCYLTVVGDESKKFFAMQGVDIAANEDLIAHCSAQNMSSKSQTVTPNVVEHRRTVFGKKMNEYKTDVVTFSPSEKKEFTFTVTRNSEPQAYTQVITLLDANGKKISNNASFHYVLQGESATIQNIVLDKVAYDKGDTAIITFTSTGSTDGFLGSRNLGGTPLKGLAVLRIMDGEGVACASEKNISFGEKSFQKENISIEKDCLNPSVFALIQNDEGKVLDSRTVSTNESGNKELNKNGVKDESGNEKGAKMTKYFTFVSIGLFITLLALFIVLFGKIHGKTRGKKMFLFFLFLSAFGVMGIFPNDVKANTYYPGACQGPCQGAQQYMTLTVDAIADKTPGSAISIPVTASFVLCANAYFDGGLGYGINKDQNRVLFNVHGEYNGLLSGGGFTETANDGAVGKTYYITSTVQTVPGNYWALFSGSSSFQHCGYYPDFSCPSHLAGTFSYSFSVPYKVVTLKQNGVCGPANGMLLIDPPTTNLCLHGTPSASGQWNWSCSGTNGGNTVNCSAIPVPFVSFSASVNSGAYGTVLTAWEGDPIKFKWSSKNVSSCSVTGFNSGLLGNPLPLHANPDPFSAGIQVKDTYTMICKNSAGNLSNPATVTLHVKCHQTDWSGWGDCTESCNGGTQSRTRRIEDCSYQSETRDCNMQACQPGGFQEVKP